MAPLFLFLFLSFFSLNLSENNLTCNVIGNSTICFKTRVSVSQEPCKDFFENPLTEPEKRYLLWLHSSLRENITKGIYYHIPKAFYMKQNFWNNTLASMAQKWADQCTTKTDPALKVSDPSVAQYVVTADETSRKTSVKELFKLLTAGFGSLNESLVSKYRNPEAGDINYEPVSQIIWWNMVEIGCGRSIYRSFECPNHEGKNCSRMVVQLVCNYSPKSLSAGKPIYYTSKNKNLICQYDSHFPHCRTTGSKRAEDGTEKEKKLEAPVTRRSERIEEQKRYRVKDKINELWAAAGSKVSHGHLLYFCYLLFIFTEYLLS